MEAFLESDPDENKIGDDINGLVSDCGVSSVLAMEIPQS